MEFGDTGESERHLMQFHRINLNMLLWPWADSPQVVGDRVKNVSRQAICAASGGD